MKEHPILFSGPMVRAILEGKKTQTRRVIHKPERLDGLMLKGEAAQWCPYGRPGDLLWVREAWKVQPTPGCTFGDAMMGRKLSVFYGDETRKDFKGGAVNASGCHIDFSALDYSPDRYGIWRPSIYMPRWASRLTLRITDVRVQRVQEITYGDVAAEGVDWASTRIGSDNGSPARDAFAHLWDKLNGKRAPWSSNPWVWAISFERVT